MKTKLIAAALVSALTLGAALPAAAQDFRGADRGAYGYQQDWRTRGQITVRTQRGQFSVDRGDRMFWRLTERPFRFRPGFTYIYTDRCNRDGCLVIETRGRHMTDRFFAPYVRFERTNWNRDDQWRNDSRDFRGPQSSHELDRRSDSRDFRGDDVQGQDYGRDDGRFGGNGYQQGGNRNRDGQLMGGPH